jgi:DNA-binding MarR family transcriptional regulator
MDIDPPAIETTAHPIQDKFGDALLQGFVVIPMVLFTHQHRLKLNDGEMLVALNLLTTWWKTERLPFIRAQAIGERMGVSARTVQRHIRGLEEKKFVRRIPDLKDRDKTSFDLSGLIKRLEFYAVEAKENEVAKKWTAGTASENGHTAESVMAAYMREL